MLSEIWNNLKPEQMAYDMDEESIAVYPDENGSIVIARRHGCEESFARLYVGSATDFLDAFMAAWQVARETDYNNHRTHGPYGTSISRLDQCDPRVESALSVHPIPSDNPTTDLARLEEGIVVDEPGRKVAALDTEEAQVGIFVGNEESSTYLELPHDEAHKVAIALLRVVRRATICGARQAAKAIAIHAMEQAVGSEPLQLDPLHDLAPA